MGRVEDIRALTEAALTSVGLELWDVEMARDVVRILVDRPGGVDLDALTLASGVISPLLDQRPEVAPDGRYQLEVSSPGAERRLRTPDQYARYVGMPITVKTTESIEGARRHHGTLLSVTERSITLRPEDSGPDGLREMRHDQIDWARTVLVWGPSPRPGSGRNGAKRARPDGDDAGHPPTANASKALDLKDTGS